MIAAVGRDQGTACAFHFHILPEFASGWDFFEPLSGCAIEIETKNQTIYQVESVLPDGRQQVFR